MALVPFGSKGKASGYHGASGPGSKGRMPKRMSNKPAMAPKEDTPSQVSDFEDVTPRRVMVADSGPNATQMDQNPRSPAVPGGVRGSTKI